MVKTRMADNKENSLSSEEVSDNEIETNDTMIITKKTLIDAFHSEYDDILNRSSNIFDNVQGFVHYVSPYINHAYEIGGIYLFWIFTHYLSSRLYVHYCTPGDLQGFIMSPFLASAPHCRATRWAIQNGADTIDQMWVVIATWFCAKLVKRA
jgi:hypothetical protein